MSVGKVQITLSEPGIRAVLEGQTSPVRKYVDVQANRLKEAVVREAPVKTGKLRKSIRVDRNWPGLKKGSVAVVADVDYALAVEKGSRPHTIRPKNATMLRFPSRGGGIVFAHSVNHPGTAPNPFMRRALDSVRR